MKNKRNIDEQTRGWFPNEPNIPTRQFDNIPKTVSSGASAALVKCPHCNSKFNYEFIPGVSFYSIRLGTHRLFKCPNCKELHTFKVTNFHSDPSLPTYGDNSETGIGIKTWGLLLGPIIVLSIMAVFLPILGFNNTIIGMSPVLVGIPWIVIYISYLYLKTRQNTNDLIKEVK
jgi:hypothetical protein